LKKHDKVAYVRFASVCLDFKDVHEFLNELQELLKKEPAAKTKQRTM
jgi:transcriptional repressor NrdR